MVSALALCVGGCPSPASEKVTLVAKPKKESLMGCCCRSLYRLVLPLAMLAVTADARAQGVTNASRWFVDFGIGFAPSINGNVSSGAIGILQGQAAAFLPQSYGDVYGTGIDWRIGGGYTLDETSEVRGILTWQSADADLVRLGDIGPSSLYAQYDDYKSFALDLGYRRYFQLSSSNIRLFGEGTIGVGIIDSIGVHFAAPQANIVFPVTNYYDRTAAFTLGFGFGALLKFSDRLDFTGQVELRHVSGLQTVDQFVGTGLETISNDTARLRSSSACATTQVTRRSRRSTTPGPSGRHAVGPEYERCHLADADLLTGGSWRFVNPA
jgi:hypothetical protein